MAYEQSIALNRFGLGARPQDPPISDPHGWLSAQLDHFDARPTSIEAAPDYRRASAQIKSVRDAQHAARIAASPQALADARGMNAGIRQFMNEQVDARILTAVQSDTPFAERLVHFWSNHFAVSTNKPDLLSAAGPFEFEAIRPNIMGRFSDLVAAVEGHPAMLSYLDQQVSVGPDSPAGKRFAKRAAGLNENLGREILELHTLGVRSGYTQADVTEFARALTGRTIIGMGAGAQLPGVYGEPFYLADIHEPGDRTILGRHYKDGQAEQAQAILADVSMRPETARHISTKLAVHFVADTPPRAVVDRMVAAFQSSGGDLKTVYCAMISAPETWAAPAGKFKSPWDWTISAMRAINPNPDTLAMSPHILQRLGQPVWQSGSPAGWGDTQATWAASDEIMRRFDVANQIAAQQNPQARMGEAAITRLLPGVLHDRTTSVLQSATSPRQQLALLLIAPEFQRR
jgi:uncharacterized protein (DUF1800 family)